MRKGKIGRFLYWIGPLMLGWFILLSPANAFNRSDFTIAVDIGHSPERPGAISARGVGEYTFNKNLAGLLHEELKKAGFTQAFLLTARNPEMNLFSRASLAGALRSDLLISVHHDSVQPHYLNAWVYNQERYYYSDEFSGYSVFYSEKNPQAEKSKLFAMLLGESLRRAGLTPTLHHAEPIPGENRPLIDADKGVYRFDELIILRESRLPAVLLECGVIVNRQEELKLNDITYQTLLVEAVVQAVETFFQQQTEELCNRRPCFKSPEDLSAQKGETSHASD